MRSRQLAPLSAAGHFGLAHERWAPRPSDADQDKKDERIDAWLKDLERIAVSPDYPQFFARWRASFGDDARVAQVELQSRLLVGHGNPGGHEIGLTVHHTWGVPVIPGSALKGLLAHRLDILHGPEDDRPDGDPERARWRGVQWDGSTITHGPGDYHRALFGAPDAGDDDERRALGRPSGASAGLVHFHDALYIPGTTEGDRPFSRDVLTVHHKPYYDRRGETWPNDWESPIPIRFVTVRPPARFLIVLTGRRGASDWTHFAMRTLLAALADWGVGGKTSLGYGRLAEVDDSLPSAPPGSPPAAPEPPAKRQPSATLTDLLDFLKSDEMPLRERLQHIETTWRERLLQLDPSERRIAATRIEKLAAKKGVQQSTQTLLDELRKS
ncbi:MAG TPA: type III-B CRISPR module RAMP protein Cmr6 [Nannocystis sp.]